MKLIPFSAQYLRVDDPLPFGLRDTYGRLLLSAGQRVPSAARLADLTRQALFAYEHEAAEWNRRLVAAMGAAMSQGGTLKDVAAARPEPLPRDAVAVAQVPLTDQWHEMVLNLDRLLREIGAASGGSAGTPCATPAASLDPENDLLARLLALHGRARQLALLRPDASLYHLVHEVSLSNQRYSCRHALLVMLVCEQVATLLGWPAERIDSLGRAALTMNVATLKLQDQIAASPLNPTVAMRAELAAHPENGALLLERCGLTDPLCLAAVRLHHDEGSPAVALAELAPEHQLARLLRRIDVFTAKISRHARRVAMLPVQAAREACLAAGGRPDEIGGALLKAVGLYPPGSFVSLVGGELGIVVARGRSANMPLVATLVSARGEALMDPPLRDTSETRFVVKAAVLPASVKVRPPHEKLLALR